jgi:hypothetical protein
MYDVLLFVSYGLVFVGRPLWREDVSVFVYAAGPCQRSLSRVRVPWDSLPYFTVSDVRLLFRRLLWLAGLRWRYSTPPPHWLTSPYIASSRTTQKTHPLPSNGCPLLIRSRCRGMCLLSRCLPMDLFVTVPIQIWKWRYGFFSCS